MYNSRLSIGFKVYMLNQCTHTHREYTKNTENTIAASTTEKPLRLVRRIAATVATPTTPATTLTASWRCDEMAACVRTHAHALDADGAVDDAFASSLPPLRWIFGSVLYTIHLALGFFFLLLLWGAKRFSRVSHPCGPFTRHYVCGSFFFSIFQRSSPNKNTIINWCKYVCVCVWV